MLKSSFMELTSSITSFDATERKGFSYNANIEQDTYGYPIEISVQIKSVIKRECDYYKNR